MKNQKPLLRLEAAGWRVKNIDPQGNVRFFQSHSVGHPESTHEADFFWAGNGELKQLADEVATE